MTSARRPCRRAANPHPAVARAWCARRGLGRRRPVRRPPRHTAHRPRSRRARWRAGVERRRCASLQVWSRRSRCGKPPSSHARRYHRSSDSHAAPKSMVRVAGAGALRRALSSSSSSFSRDPSAAASAGVATAPSAAAPGARLTSSTRYRSASTPGRALVAGRQPSGTEARRIERRPPSCPPCASRGAGGMRGVRHAARTRACRRPRAPSRPPPPLSPPPRSPPPYHRHHHDYRGVPQRRTPRGSPVGNGRNCSTSGGSQWYVCRSLSSERRSPSETGTPCLCTS